MPGLTCLNTSNSLLVVSWPHPSETSFAWVRQAVVVVAPAQLNPSCGLLPSAINDLLRTVMSLEMRVLQSIIQLKIHV